MYVGVPTGPLVARMIRLRVDLGHNSLEHNHHAIALHDSPEVPAVSVATALVSNLEAKLRPIEVKAGLQVVHNKEWSNAI